MFRAWKFFPPMLLAGVGVSMAAEPATLPAKEKVHLYLLIGQSNLAGRGVIEDQDKVPHPRV